MAVSAYKTYSAGEVLTASDLNASFSQIHDNGEDLAWPATKAKDLDGNSLTLDSDGDTSITADTDDQIDFAIGGTDVVSLVATRLDLDVPMFIKEAANAAADVAAYGQFWVKTATPNTPMFTNDAGTDAEIAVLDGLLQDLDTLGAATTDGQFIVATGAGAFAYESGATVRTSLGLGATDGVTFGSVAIAGNLDMSTNGNRIDLDTDNDTSIRASADDTLDIEVAGNDIIQITSPGTDGGCAVVLTDTGAGSAVGPTIDFKRHSASPADDDAGGAIRHYFYDDATSANSVKVAQFDVVLEDATEDSVDSRYRWWTMDDGTLAERMSLDADVLLIGKTAADNGDTVGIEFNAASRSYFAQSGSWLLDLNRKTNDGVLINFKQAGSAEGNITVNGANVTLTAFCGAHVGQWAEKTETPPVGTVLVNTGVAIDDVRKYNYVRIADKVKDKAVCGVFDCYIGGENLTAAPKRRELNADWNDYKIQYHAAGMTPRCRVVGKVEVGDYLCTSDVPGCAMAQDDDLRHNYTIGKAMRAHDGEGEGLIPVEFV